MKWGAVRLLCVAVIGASSVDSAASQTRSAVGLFRAASLANGTVDEWTVSQVADYLARLLSPAGIAQFRAHHIAGEDLLELDAAELAKMNCSSSDARAFLEVVAALRDEHDEFKTLIGQVILDKNARLRTVVTKRGAIHAQFRSGPARCACMHVCIWACRI